MNATKHTPGPWLLNDSPHHHGGRKTIVWTNEGPGHGAICETVSAGILPGPEQLANAEANASLIATAPEMLSALVYIEQFCGTALTKEQAETLGKRARATIAKATGKDGGA